MPLTSSLLAAFVSPALFYTGAAAMAAPILIHLLARRRFKRIRWAAMDFLIDAERRNRRRLRMEEWILLALRCLAVMLIGSMLARPFLNPGSLAVVWGGFQCTERVFVLDDSLSMGYRTSDGVVFDRVKTAVHRLVESVRREAPEDSITMLRMSAPGSPLDSGIHLDDAQTDELLARLNAIVPSQRFVDPARTIEGVVGVLERNPGITNAAIYVLSDFQRSNWIEAGRAGSPTGQSGADGSAPDPVSEQAGEAAARTEVRGSGILSPLAEWAGDDRGLRVLLIDVGADVAPNLALTELALRGGQAVAGTSGRLSAKVSNYTSDPANNVELEVTVGNFAQSSQTVHELRPGRSASVDLEVEFMRPGSEAMRVELVPDALPVDNVRYAAAEVASAIRVLIVNGEPSADSFDDEVIFLTTALRPEGNVFSGNEVVVVDEARLGQVHLKRFHTVILANVYRVSDPVVESLERFVRGGGGLLVFLGDQVDADMYNTALHRAGEGLLPAELTEVIRAAEASHLVISDRLHPVLRRLSSEGDPLGISDIPFFEYFGCRPSGVTAEALIGNIAGASSVALADRLLPATDDTNVPAHTSGIPEPARVVARFDDVGRHPAIIERAFGHGRVILVTTAVDKEWSLWPDHPTFLPVMIELTHRVARRHDTGAGYIVGDVIELPIDPAFFEPDVLVRTPAYPDEREVSLTATPTGDEEGLKLRWEHTGTAGPYRFVLRRREGGEHVRIVSVNVDPREGDLTAAEPAELRQVLGNVPFEYIAGLDGLADATGEARTELWRLFLFAVAAVLMTEQCLAWWWGRRH